MICGNTFRMCSTGTKALARACDLVTIMFLLLYHPHRRQLSLVLFAKHEFAPKGFCTIGLFKQEYFECLPFCFFSKQLSGAKRKILADRHNITMTSRKRAQGKARKNKARPSPPDELTQTPKCRTGHCFGRKYLDRFTPSGALRNINECLHGPALYDTVNEHVAELVCRVWASRVKGRHCELVRIDQLHPYVWADKELRELAITALIRLATDVLVGTFDSSVLHLEDSGAKYDCANCIAFDIALLETRTHFRWFSLCHVGALRIGRDLCYGGPNETKRFFGKGKQCTCITNLVVVFEGPDHDQRTIQTLLGRHSVCYNCHQIVRMKKVLLCSGCGYEQYCSIACQRADWARHREFCEEVQSWYSRYKSKFPKAKPLVEVLNDIHRLVRR